ncbi:MAG: hypothetical protein JW955_13725 [Sedimentisphaerales bacterium]|nr:hypothetical protein [Sedimentisphaerales bacterium]
MTKKEDSARSKPGRVLRAADVIPPFNASSNAQQGAGQIPTFDLAENILAEHRRTAARRRKAPSQAQAEPEVQPVGSVVKTHVVEPPPQDLLDLHRVVAEIVARDIERLCKKPAASLHG